LFFCLIFFSHIFLWWGENPRTVWIAFLGRTWKEKENFWSFLNVGEDIKGRMTGTPSKEISLGKGLDAPHVRDFFPGW
jgi:hypothetical protein